MSRLLLTALVTAALASPLGVPPSAAEPRADDDRAGSEETGDDAFDRAFAPIAELAGHCWVGTFADSEVRDMQCWEWVLDGKFVRNRHRVMGGESPYAGETFYGWDADAGIVRFWYFNTLGGVSTGTVEQDGERLLVREQYAGKTGGGAHTAELEIRSTMTREDDVSYTVTSEKRQGEGDWQKLFEIRFVRFGVRPAQTGGAWAERWDLAFNTARDDNYEVYVRDLRTGEERRLTTAPDTEWVYTADGETLIIVSNRDVGGDAGYRLYRLRIDGELVQLSDFPVSDSWVGVLPEGRGYVACAQVDGDQELLLLDAEGKVLRKLTDNDADDCQPDVTPDGRTVVFWSNRGGNAELWAMDLGPGGAPGEARQLTRFPGNDDVARHGYGGEGPPRVSPDGKRIAWLSKRDGEDWDVYVMNLDGTKVRRLTDHLANDGYVSWSPDGEWLAFDSNRAGSYDLYVIRPDGTELTRVTDHPGSEQAPVWIPRR